MRRNDCPRWTGICIPSRTPEPPRRFPTPWHANKIPGGSVVRDANGQELAYIYSRENEAEARQAKVLTVDEARRIAVNIAQLPELLGKGETGHATQAGGRSSLDYGEEPRRKAGAVNISVTRPQRTAPLSPRRPLLQGAAGRTL
jgi:hypothetical protein